MKNAKQILKALHFGIRQFMAIFGGFVFLSNLFSLYSENTFKTGYWLGGIFGIYYFVSQLRKSGQAAEPKE